MVLKPLSEFGPIFANEQQRKHFAEYLTGLMIAQNKTVTRINSEFAKTTDQSCLNRFFTDSPQVIKDFNELRLELMQGEPDMRYSEHRVIAMDDTLMDYSGKFKADVGYYWNHAKERSKQPCFPYYLCRQSVSLFDDAQDEK